MFDFLKKLLLSFALFLLVLFPTENTVLTLVFMAAWASVELCLSFSVSVLSSLAKYLKGLLIACDLARCRHKRFSIVSPATLYAAALLILAFLPSLSAVAQTYTPLPSTQVRAPKASYYVGDFVTGATFTATTANGSPTLSLVTSFTNLAVGQGITGTGIPANTTISSMNTGAFTITMSANATATNVGITVTANGMVKNNVTPGTYDATVVTASGYDTSMFLAPLTVTGDVTNGSTSVVNVSPTTNIAAGQSVLGGGTTRLAGIPAGTTASTFSGSTLTLSANYTGTTNTGKTLKIASPPFTAAYTAGDSASRPIIYEDYPSMRLVDNGTLRQAVKFPAPTTGSNGWTIVAAMSIDFASGLQTDFISDATTLSTWYMYVNNGVQTFSTAGGGTPPTSINRIPQKYLKFWIIQFNPNTKVLRFTWDVQLDNTSTTSGVWYEGTLANNLDLTGVQLGSPVGSAQSNKRVDLYWSMLNVYDGCLTDNELRREMKNVAKSLAPSDLVCFYPYGNSLVLGTQASNTQTTSARALFKTWLTTTKSHTNAVYVENSNGFVVGRPTRTMLGMINSTGNYPYYMGLCPRNVVFYTEATNEYYLYAVASPYSFAGGANSIASHWVVHRQREIFWEYFPYFDYLIDSTAFKRAAGDNTGYRPDVYNDAPTWVATLRGYQLGHDFGYRQAAAGETAPLTDNTNTTYFNADAVHLNDTGYSSWATAWWEPYGEAACFPGTPGVVTAGTGGGSSITGVTWTGAGTGPTGNTLTEQLQFAKRGTYNFANMGGATASPADITGLDAGTQYDYRVAYTDANDSANPVYSNIITTSTTGSPTDNTTPTISSVTVDTSGMVMTVNLSKACRGSGGFHIYTNINSVYTETKPLFYGKSGDSSIAYFLPISVLASQGVKYTYLTGGDEGDVYDCTTNSNRLAAVTSQTAITTNNSRVSLTSFSFYFPAIGGLANVAAGPLDVVGNTGSVDPLEFVSQGSAQWSAVTGTFTNAGPSATTIATNFTPPTYLVSNIPQIAPISITVTSTLDGTTQGSGVYYTRQTPRVQPRKSGKLWRRRQNQL